jgi:hypothetical protein
MAKRNFFLCLVIAVLQAAKAAWRDGRHERFCRAAHLDRGAQVVDVRLQRGLSLIRDRTHDRARHRTATACEHLAIDLRVEIGNRYATEARLRAVGVLAAGVGSSHSRLVSGPYEHQPAGMTPFNCLIPLSTMMTWRSAALPKVL